MNQPGNAFAAIINSIAVPVIVADRMGVVVSWNRCSSEYFEEHLSAGEHVSSYLNINEDDLKRDLSHLSDELFIHYSDVHIINPTDVKNNKSADLTLSLLKSGGDEFSVFTIIDRTLAMKVIPSIGKLKGTVDESPSSILITDRYGIVEYTNANFQNLTGYSLNELHGKNVNILQPEFFSKDNSKMWERLNRGEKWKGEFLNLKKNGELYWAIVSIAPIFDKSGVVTHYISIQEDITYLKKKEEELKQSEEKLRILFESLPEGILVIDPEGMVIQTNRAYIAIFGFSDPGDVTGRNVFDLFDYSGSRVIEEVLKDALVDGYSDVKNYEVPGDETKFIDLRAVLISDDKKNPQAYLVLASDVTNRRSSEKALRESEARNRALIEAIPDIMFRVNDDGVYLDKMLGAKIHEVFPDDIAVKAVSHISEALKSREIQIFEYPVTVSMEERCYEARFIAIEDHEVLVILRNVTEKRKAMEEIESARREAELANRAKSEFLANMSHEIRTPLNSITGFIELLMRTKVNDAQKEYLGIVKKSASNLLEIINDILDFSKIESHKLEISMVDFDPYTEFENIIRLFSVRAQEKGIVFISYIDPQIPTGIISDPLRIKQILSNLLSNAIKFTPADGSVIIEIKLFRMKDDISMISFSVADTGIGIPERKQASIFEAFTQVDGSVTRKYGGTGLGLSISSSLAKLMGSEIVLESRIGIGSRFYFTIETQVSRNGTMRDFFSLCADLNACIVSSLQDDLILLNAEYYLQSFGLNINFIQDLRKCGSCNCDIYIVINSVKLMDELRSCPSLFGGKPAILITGNPDDDGYSDLKHLFRSILHQPLSPEEIAGSIVSALDIDTEKKHTPVASREKGRIRFRGKILVGEDNLINQKLMILLLRDYGVDVRIAGNGLDVFELYKKEKYDLILMDVHMPVADGIETAGMIRDYESEKGLPHIPVIALTAKVLNDDRAVLSESGMDGYLSKPVEIEKLESVLSEYLIIEEFDYSRPGKASSGASDMYYNIKKVAEELKIPVNVLESLGRDFFDDAIEGVWELKTADLECDYNMMKMISHKLKGASANLRFTRLSKMLEHIEENSAVSNREFDYAGIIKDIIIEIDLLKTFV